MRLAAVLALVLVAHPAWAKKGKADKDKSLKSGRVVHVTANKAPGANTLELVDRVKELLPQLRQ